MTQAVPRPRQAIALLHYWLPIAVGWSLALLAAHTTGQPLSFSGTVLLMAGIGAAYSLDRLLDPPGEFPLPTPLTRILLVGATCFTAAGLVAAWLAPGRLLPVALGCGIISLAYPRLKRLPMAKTIAVAFVWTWAALVLPLGGEASPGWILGFVEVAPILFLLFASACLLCDLKDVTADRSSAVPSLPARLGIPATCVTAVLLALAATVLAVLEQRWGLILTGVALSVAAAFPRFLARPYAGPITIDALFLIPGILIASGWV